MHIIQYYHIQNSAKLTTKVKNLYLVFLHMRSLTYIIRDLEFLKHKYALQYVFD